MACCCLRDFKNEYVKWMISLTTRSNEIIVAVFLIQLEHTVGIISSLAHVGIPNTDTAERSLDGLPAFNPLIDFDFGRTERRTGGEFALFVLGGGGAAHYLFYVVAVFIGFVSLILALGSPVCGESGLWSCGCVLRYG